MKKIALSLLLIILLLTSTGCTNPYQPYWFETLYEMKAQTANKLLYPDILPIESAFSMINGFKHTSTNAWDYIIDIRCYDPTQPNIRFDEVVENITEGYPVVERIEITALEMENRARGRLVPDKIKEKEEYELFAASGADKWDIHEVSVTYKSAFSADFISSVNANTASDYTVYLIMDAYAAFMYDGVLYMVSSTLIGHRSETVEEMLKAVDILKDIVTGMIV